MPAPRTQPSVSPLLPESSPPGPTPIPADTPHDPTHQHRQDLALVRTQVMVLISLIEGDLVTALPEEIEDKSYSYGKRWGDKENAVGALIKLTGILFKLVPLEQQLYAGKTLPVPEAEPLTEEDEAILARYMERVI